MSYTAPQSLWLAQKAQELKWHLKTASATKEAKSAALAAAYVAQWQIKDMTIEGMNKMANKLSRKLDRELSAMKFHFGISEEGANLSDLSEQTLVNMPEIERILVTMLKDQEKAQAVNVAQTAAQKKKRVKELGMGRKFSTLISDHKPKYRSSLTQASSQDDDDDDDEDDDEDNDDEDADVRLMPTPNSEDMTSGGDGKKKAAGGKERSDKENKPPASISKAKAMKSHSPFLDTGSFAQQLTAALQEDPEILASKRKREEQEVERNQLEIEERKMRLEFLKLENELKLKALSKDLGL
jgi:hypothetical protein